MPCPAHPTQMYCACASEDPYSIDSYDIFKPAQSESLDTFMSDIPLPNEAILTEPADFYTNNAFVAPVANMTSDLDVTTFQSDPNWFAQPVVNTTQGDNFYSEYVAPPPVCWLPISAEDHYSERFALSPVDNGPSLPEDHYSDRFALSPIENETQNSRDVQGEKTSSDSSSISRARKESVERGGRKDAGSVRSRQNGEVPASNLRRSSRPRKVVDYNLHEESDESNHE